MLSCKDVSILCSSGFTTVFGGPLVAAEGKMSESVSILCNVTNNPNPAKKVVSAIVAYYTHTIYF